jgi:sialate O-acetylesterase
MNKMRLFLTCSFLIVLFIATAEVKINSLFSDHMILQMGVSVRVWGKASEGEKVTVSFNGQKISTNATNGKWMIKLSPMPYVLTPSTMTITGENTIVIHDILVGENWLCSGQSNMERQLGPRPPQPLITDWEKERDSAVYPLIREYYVPLNYSKSKVDDVKSSWTVCSPQTVTDFSAIGYFFSKNLFLHLKIPVGIIFSAYGGTPAEDWTSQVSLESNHKLSGLIRDYDKVTTTWKPKGKTLSGLYNGMIYPLLPFAIKGVVWYQGESNNDRPAQYQTILTTMIQNWRRDFKQGDIPFLIVQIAPNKDMSPEIRESQFLVQQRVKNTALIVTTDCGDAGNIHPSDKQPVGKRIAIAARVLAYKEKIESSGPTYLSFKIKKNLIFVRFTHVGHGLISKNIQELKGFTIAGTDKKFEKATAIIKGNQVIVSNNQIKNPFAVRYGWANVPDVNLFNIEGMPASPFRTDIDK